MSAVSIINNIIVPCQGTKKIKPTATKKRAFASTKAKQPTKKRKVISLQKNMAPSVAYANESQVLIKEHAHERIQLFYITTLALYKKAERTGQSPSEVTVSIPGAAMQVGQAAGNNHAAHPNASANVADNLKACLIDQTVKEGLTPKKKALFLAKNIPSAELEELQKNHANSQFVNDLINKYWPASSLISGTPLEYTLNKTNYLPKELNLGCDLVLEKSIRPYMEVLYAKVLKGELTPEDATTDYCKKVQKHFENRIATMEQTTEKTEKLLKQLSFHQLELEGTQMINMPLLRKGFERDDDEEMIDVEKTFQLFV